jgi:hypothetical protein
VAQSQGSYHLSLADESHRADRDYEGYCGNDYIEKDVAYTTKFPESQLRSLCILYLNNINFSNKSENEAASITRKYSSNPYKSGLLTS